MNQMQGIRAEMSVVVPACSFMNVIITRVIVGFVIVSMTHHLSILVFITDTISDNCQTDTSRKLNVMASSSSSSSSNSPCAACKFLRRKCMPGCIFAPYFPPEEPQKFANVHKIFGASNVTKLLNELLPHQREDAVNSLAYEAEARMKDPVYGCVGAISVLQRQVHRLQKELDAANADLIRYACNDIPISSATLAPPQQGLVPPNMMGGAAPLRQRSFEFGRRGSSTSTAGSSFYPGAPANLQLPYPSPWSNNPSGDMNTTRGGGGSTGDGENNM